MTSANVTRRRVTLSTSPNATTGWYTKTYTASSIKMVIQNKNSSFIHENIGYKAIYDLTGFTSAPIRIDDEIIGANGNYYIVKSVQQEWKLDVFSHYVCELVEKIQQTDRPATYGTASSTTDSRTTVKSLLDINLSSSALTKDDGTTEVSWLVCWSKPDYHLERLLLPCEKNKDLIFTVSSPIINSQAANNVVVNYSQTVTIGIYVVNKSGITANNLLWKAEAELRRVIETYGLGSIRINMSQQKDYGLPEIFNQEYTVTLPTVLDVTLRSLSLGTADATTGLYAKSYATSTIQMSFMPKGSSQIQTSAGTYVKHDLIGVTSDAVLEGDQILHNSVYYEVTHVQVHPVLSLVNNTSPFSYYFCYLTKLPLHVDRAATSGTWHLDSASLKTDPRSRVKLLLDTYVTAASIKKDDGATNASTITCFEADYPLSRVLISTGKNVDAIAAISRKPSVPAMHAVHRAPYAFDEQVQIELYAVNKLGVTATNLLEQYEQEIRHVITDHPVGSVRSIKSIEPKNVDLGNATLYSTGILINYRRYNDDLIPTVPTFSHTVAYTYEGDRLTGGAEGAWTLTQGGGSTCTQTITTDRNLYLNQTVFGADSSTVHATNLALSSSLYGRVRIRYKTSGNATAKVVLNFTAGTQTLLSETASSTFTVVDVAITAAKTINTIQLYCCDGVGTVTYDFIQIYAGNYIIPNVAKMPTPQKLKDVIVGIPGMSGDVTQGLGSELLEVHMTCELDMEHSSVTWKRPQGGVATDANKTDALYELLHLSGINTAWTWLDLGDPAMQFKARLVEVVPSLEGEGNMVDLVFREYRHGHANSETASERYGLSL